MVASKRSERETFHLFVRGISSVPLLLFGIFIASALLMIASPAPVSGAPSADRKNNRDESGWIEETPEEKQRRQLEAQDPAEAFENEVDRENEAARSGFGSSSASGAGSNVETSDGRTTLKIGVKHSATLAPIPSQLKTGSTFNEKFLPAEPERLEWYRIPHWLAGKWRRDIETSLFTYTYDNRSGTRESRSFQSQQMADFGVQKDRIGGIWHCNLATRGVSDLGGYLAVASVISQTPVKLTANEIVFREEFTVVHVNKSNAVIIDSFRMESLTKYTLTRNGVYTTASVKAYKPDGTPKQLQKNVAQERLVRPFAVLDKYKGRDVRADFVQFLTDSGQPNLVPR
jgi:hypothetical protein